MAKVGGAKIIANSEAINGELKSDDFLGRFARRLHHLVQSYESKEFRRTR